MIKTTIRNVTTTAAVSDDKDDNTTVTTTAAVSDDKDDNTTCDDDSSCQR